SCCSRGMAPFPARPRVAGCTWWRAGGSWLLYPPVEPLQIKQGHHIALDFDQPAPFQILKRAIQCAARGAELRRQLSLGSTERDLDGTARARQSRSDRAIEQPRHDPRRHIERDRPRV